MTNATDLPQEFELNSELTDDLSAKQLQFLLERPKHSSDDKCRLELGLAKNTVQVWRGRKESFKTLHDELRRHLKLALVDFNRPQYIKDNLVPLSIKRLEEVLDQEITKKTGDARIRTISQVALKVLTGAGILQPEVAQVNNFNTIVAEAINDGASFKAPWMLKDNAVTPELPVANADQ